MGFFRRLFGGGQDRNRGPSLPLDLARRGWTSHKFPNSNVVVFLPKGIAAAHDPEGVLMGSTTGEEVEFSATLHGDFDGDRAAALGFFSHLARERELRVQDKGIARSELGKGG